VTSRRRLIERQRKTCLGRGLTTRGLRIDLNWARAAVTLVSARSPVLVPDRIPVTTDRPVELQPDPSRRVCALIDIL
jgi:hypothetical protein